MELGFRGGRCTVEQGNPCLRHGEDREYIKTLDIWVMRLDVDAAVHMHMQDAVINTLAHQVQFLLK